MTSSHSLWDLTDAPFMHIENYVFNCVRFLFFVNWTNKLKVIAKRIEVLPFLY
jgi:hypothetical protein